MQRRSLQSFPTKTFYLLWFESLEKRQKRVAGTLLVVWNTSQRVWFRNRSTLTRSESLRWVVQDLSQSTEDLVCSLFQLCCLLSRALQGAFNAPPPPPPIIVLDSFNSPQELSWGLICASHILFQVWNLDIAPRLVAVSLPFVQTEPCFVAGVSPSRQRLKNFSLLGEEMNSVRHSKRCNSAE